MAYSADLRLRSPSAQMLALPWERRLEDWDDTVADLREMKVGPSRHLVRFVQADGRLWAIKQLPQRVAHKEYTVLRDLEARNLPAVRAVGLVQQPEQGNALLVTRYLERSWQFRRLLLRLPPNRPRQRARLLDAMAGLLVDLHRSGVYWGDCSLANTLFSRDGQRLQAWLVDAETSEVHRTLSPGQRAQDLEIMVENVAGGLLDLAVMLDRPEEIYDQLVQEATEVAPRYESLWQLLHEEPLFGFDDRLEVQLRIRRLNELGFAVEEVDLAPAGSGDDRLRLRVGVAARSYHAGELFELAGIRVGEGQARELLADLQSFQATHPELTSERDPVAGGSLPAPSVQRWIETVLRPGMSRSYESIGRIGDPVQAYCDLLEVRWLLSEQQGRDVGDAVALEALASRSQPTDSAAMAVVAEADTVTMERPTREQVDAASRRGLAAQIDV